jgi:uncharacterized membrane protein HdeD (DUF308 family)
MKWILNALGVLLILMGIVWFLQGINILLGSPMSGHILYSILGSVLGVIGVILLVFANRRRKQS